LKYRSLSQSDSESLRDAILANENLNVDELGQEVGDGDLLDLTPVKELCAKAVARCESESSSEQIELEYSGDLYLILRAVPVEVRDDPGFWRWVTATALLPFLKLREAKNRKPIGREAIGAGTNRSDILACRMFLRAQVARRVLPDGKLDFSTLTELGAKHHDFWQSHIVRVSTGSEQGLAHALITSHLRDHIPTSDLRVFVRDRINKPKNTVATYLMSEDEAASYVAKQRYFFTAEGPHDDLR